MKTIKNSFILALLFSSIAVAQKPTISIKDDSTLMFGLEMDKTASYQVTLSSSEDFYLRKIFQAGQPIKFDLNELPSDGLVKTEIIEQPFVSKETLSLIRSGDKTTIEQMTKNNTHQVNFRLENSAISNSKSKEDDGDGDGGQTRDQVIADDLIVDGSLCVGLDCVNGENFGFDTLRLKENNLRLHFDDTSATASFPGNDWRITINDSSNGGSNYFALEDSTAGTTPFRVESAAGNNALHVSGSGGNVGLGTSTPVVELHVTDGDSPTVRLEQNGASGFTPQTWDLAGNETNFFIRDVTNGSQLPFKIRPGAKNDLLYLQGNNIGINQTNPAYNLHINTVGGIDANIGLRNADSTTVNWVMSNNDTTNKFEISDPLAANGAALSLDGTGNLTIAGLLVQNSNVHAKHHITELSPANVLEKLNTMPIHQWQYKAMKGNHIGPMAQDFHSTFQLGQDESKIATLDVAGVALVAIQGLSQELTKRDDQIKNLEEKISQLEASNLKQQKLLTDLGSYEARLAKMEQLFKNQEIQMVSNSIHLNQNDDLEVNQNTLD